MPDPVEARSSLRVREAAAGDMDAVITLVNAAFAVETFLEGTRTDEDRIARMLSRGTFLVGADQNGRIVASVYVEVRGASGYMGMLAVDPDRQGEGHGRRLADATEAHARAHGCSEMEIDVLSLRTELLPFYRKRGYIETGTAVFHPSRPLKPGVECHSITMSKTL